MAFDYSPIPIPEDFTSPLWEILPGESTLWYDRFHKYLIQGPSRTIAHVAADIGIAYAPLTEYAKRYRWEERAKAYDNEELRKERAIVEAMRFRAKLQRMNLLDAFGEKLAYAVDFLDEEYISWKSFADSLKVLSQESRAEFEGNTQKIELTGKDGGNIKIESEISVARENLIAKLNRISANRGTDETNTGNGA